MLRKGHLVFFASCLLTLGWVGCSDDDGSTCGNGVAEGGEQCDLNDLKNMTCPDVVSGSQGTLVCTATCTYDTSPCQVCGDGTMQFGEQCDCGTNSAALPAGCTDVNGGANANCSATCTRQAVCGDGRKDGAEECDCGTTTPLPTGCDDVNGGANANCDSDCMNISQCNVEEPFDECDPLVLGDCCDDPYGVEMECLTSIFVGMDNMCNRSCSTGEDCWWNTSCFSSYSECLYNYCGEGNFINASFFADCQPSGGSAGVCIPFGRYIDTHEAFGFCFENGTIAHGADCPADADLFTTDREADGGAADKMCDMGLCYAATGATTGTCFQFCDWESAYAVAFYGAASSTDPMPCPTGSNCFPESTIDEDTGYRSGDYAACRLTEETDPDGLTACTHVGGFLLESPNETCADAGFTNGVCAFVNFNDGQGGTVTTFGSPIGACMDGTAAPNLAVWASCDPSNTNQVCPVGTVCEQPDVFAATPDAGERCVPYCDTASPAGTEQHCVDLGAQVTSDGTPLCRSMSLLFPPDGPNDTSKTRLGLCGTN